MPVSEISPITNAEPGLSVLNQPIAVPPSATHPAAIVSKSALAASSPTTASAPAASTRRPAVRGGGSGGGASSASLQQLITDTYTTTVGGVSYSGSVQQEPGGQFVASIPNVPGAIASGSSIEAAEIALGTLINALA